VINPKIIPIKMATLSAQ